METRNFDHSLGGRDGNLIIFTESSRIIEPREGTFNYPSPREFFPLVGLDFTLKYQRRGQAALSDQKRKCPDILRPRRTSE